MQLPPPPWLPFSSNSSSRLSDLLELSHNLPAFLYLLPSVVLRKADYASAITL